MKVPMTLRVGAGATFLGLMAAMLVPNSSPAQGFRPAMPPAPPQPGPLRPPTLIVTQGNQGAAGQGGIPVDEAAVRIGLCSVVWEGRLEVIDDAPRVLLDGAHNPAASRALAQYLGEFLASHQNGRIILVWEIGRAHV